MDNRDDDGCEVWIDGRWVVAPLAEAHTQYRNGVKRCRHCHGKIRTQGTYTALQRIVMAHLRTHDGCPRMPRLYAGTPKADPEALT